MTCVLGCIAAGCKNKFLIIFVQIAFDMMTQADVMC